ncbi:hypothetical protein BS47DRAFT_1396583 [Hydnum rufescens UP504]|uniref:Uncharacterized protein n=1 Tax=Hydnum rufescens UP504 TaxID=1448309 RepID=A0A9P6DQ74_9AGAM|nr:hypothetical protein BS47DRAFT_1396583 [Hydnum rufescens UP504]
MRLLVTCLLLHLAETWAHDQITLHDTHPLISYSPDTTCIPLPFHWWETCHRRHSPWALKDYQDRNTGLSQSYHVVSDRRNGAKGEGPREISFVLHAIYGAPPSVVGSPAAQEICIDDLVCHNLDVESAYLHAKDMDDRVLIWSGDIPNPDPQPHRIVIRMIGSSSLEAEPEKFMTLDRVIYTPDTGYESPRSYPLPAGATIKEISIEDTSRRIAYYGVEICTSWWWWRLLAGCSSTASPWEGKLFQVKAGSTAPWRPQIRTETYHQATTMFDVGKQDPQTQAIFNFKGSAVCVYGAPRSQITYPHGAQQVCLDEMCHYIDAHQLYLNIPHVTSSSRIFPAQLSTSNNVSSASSEALEDQPVLLWCAEGLDYTMRHRLVYKLVEPNPRYGPGDGGVRKGMTVAHIAYARVLRHRPVFDRATTEA